MPPAQQKNDMLWHEIIVLEIRMSDFFNTESGPHVARMHSTLYVTQYSNIREFVNTQYTINSESTYVYIVLCYPNTKWRWIKVSLIGF